MDNPYDDNPTPSSSDEPFEHDWPVTDDPWHAHDPSEAHQPAHGETASPAAVAAVGGLGFLITIVCVALIAFYFKQETQRIRVEQVEKADLRVEARRMEELWRKRLTAVGQEVEVPGGQTAVVRAAIDEAERAVAQEYAKAP